jgi:hypothetical protein
MFVKNYCFFEVCYAALPRNTPQKTIYPEHMVATYFLKILIQISREGVYFKKSVGGINRMNRRNQRTSIVWPLILIFVGIIWLLGNLGILLPVHTISLLQLWPLVFIIIGLDLIFGTRYRHAAVWIGLGAVVVVILFLWIGPGLGVVQTPVKETSVFQVPLDNADTAEVNLKLSIPKTEIKALTNSSDIFLARVDHIWSMAFSSQGDKNKVISMQREEYLTDWFTWMAFGEELQWDIGLTSRLPLKLKVNSGIGSTTLNLKDIRLKELSLDVGIGRTSLHLPKALDRYLAQIKGGIGDLAVDLPCTNAELRLGTGTGKVEVNLSNGCGLRIEVNNAGAGEIRLPSGLVQVRKGNTEREGAWENAVYASSPEKILVVVDHAGVGLVSIR